MRANGVPLLRRVKHLQLILNNWVFKAVNEEQWLPAMVPGDVHTDLLRNGRIEAPFDGTNEHRLQWVGKQNWEYQTELVLDDDWLAQETAELVFEGLDTYAEVSVNGQLVISADNMFREWRADVKERLHAGTNTVHILFRSPVLEDLPKLAKLGYDLPATNDQSELGGLGEQRISVFARKAPYHYGWDWGPRFLGMGIWREVRLEAGIGPVFRNMFIRQNRISSQRADLTAVVEIMAASAWSGTLKVSTGELAWEQPVRLAAGMNTAELDFRIEQPKLWWCRGYGEAHLYEFKAELLPESMDLADEPGGPGRLSELKEKAGGAFPSGAARKAAEGVSAAAEISATTGLREIRLVTEKDEHGAAFRFELNGVPVFIKGANHIPNDSFSPEVTEERYRHEMATAAASHMNMLRVWGGGIYEEEIFYRLCDEYGLLVWQDFMFACSMYPGDPHFLENVAAEAEYNIKRLRNHPSIALWCGNNEIDSAWSEYEENRGWGWKEQIGSQEIRARIWRDYEAVFHELLPQEVAKHHPDIVYWPSSPLRALTGNAEQHATRITGEGDIHYWGVWHSSEPFEYYGTHIGRFMSEYGFQSFPELKSVLSYAREEELELESEVMLAHQKNGHGNRLIKEYMDKYLPEPKDFKAFLYMSQVLQAEAIRMAIEAHRRSKPYCMGTLYWQMNDCWPVASWSSMDYYGRWKALQYAVKRSFRDILLSVNESVEGTVEVYAVSDLRTSRETELNVALYDLSGRELSLWREPVALAADSSAILFSKSRSQLLQGHDAERVLLRVWLTDGEEVWAEQGHYFVKAAELPLEQSHISVTEANGGRKITLRSDKLARFVQLTSETEGVFSDNYFDLLPGETRTVEFFRRGSAEETAAFVPAAPEGLKAASMADYIKPTI